MSNYFKKRALLFPKPPKPTDAVSARVDPLGTPLQIKSVDLCISENGSIHHTSPYPEMRMADPSLVVRRGQPFKIKIHLSREYSPGIDFVNLVFCMQGDNDPAHYNVTYVILPLMGEAIKPKDLAWKTVMKAQEPTMISVEITPPANCVVGKWELDIDSKFMQSQSYRHVAGSVYILFNPWCKDDTVYLSDEEKINEYLMNDVGLIWCGTIDSNTPVSWRYGQFDSEVMDCAFHLINDVGKLPFAKNADPIAVTRKISGIANSNDDNGLLEGAWDTEFLGGVTPMRWTGSTAIMRQYYTTKASVKYGQCWVFAGAVTTICRAIGIPCRPVTCFGAGHVRGFGLTIDCVLDQYENRMDDLSTETTWNFHVWNEVWMARPDLGFQYGGWQAIDSTPQERSELDGTYDYGPCSINAIKDSDILKPYDGTFTYAEVNAEEVTWKYMGPNQPLKLVSFSSNSVGLGIYTKKVGEWEGEDILLNYKYPEGSMPERHSLAKAIQAHPDTYSRYYLDYLNLDKINVELDPIPSVTVGNPFTVTMHITNYTGITCKVKGSIRLHRSGFNGKVEGTPLLEAPFPFSQLESNIRNEATMEVKYSDYKRASADNEYLKIAYVIHVPDLEYDFYQEKPVYISKPLLSMDRMFGEEFPMDPDFSEIWNWRSAFHDEALTPRNQVPFSCSFINPLPEVLETGTFMFEGPGGNILRVELKEPVDPGKVVRVKGVMPAPEYGELHIVSRFYSPQLGGISGWLVPKMEK